MPQEAYLSLDKDAAAQIQSLKGRSLVFGLLRLLWLVAIFFIGAELMAAQSQLAIPIAGLCVVLFLVLTMFHARIDQRVQWHKNRQVFCKQAMDRAAGNWQHDQADGSSYLDAWHPYAHDLDLVGSHGLFALLNTTASESGTQALARLVFNDEEKLEDAWQHSVHALTTLHQRRVDWWASMQLETRLWSADEERACFNAYSEWLHREQEKPASTIMLGVARAFIVMLLVLGFLMVGWTWLWTGCLLIAGLASLLNDRACRAWADIDVDRVDRLLRSWERGVAVILEGEAKGQSCFDQKQLTALQSMQAALRVQVSAWHGLALASNPFWRFGIGALLLSDWHYQSRLVRWRAQGAEDFDQHLHVLGQMDACFALATYAAEQGGVWATEPEDQMCMIDVEDLAHPLIPAEQRVGNDIKLNIGQVLLLTGANASGKSTFLRSLALAVLLARLGLPVPAKRCAIQPQRLATVMRIHDALWQGLSRFQAEVRQLKQVMERSQSEGDPVLLILDEILGGTNSEERRLGTLAFVRHFRDYQGLILITTHDLALTSIAEEEPERICCYHFADRAELDAVNADIHFDYKLRPGVVQTTNALKVMQAAGLPIK